VALSKRPAATGTFQNNHRWARNFKKCCATKAKRNLERNTPNAIALLNHLKHIALQQLMLRMQVFTKKILSAKNASATF
jgi:hypothetical protein